MTTMPRLTIAKGELLAYRLYDVAEEIDLDAAVRLSKKAATRLKLGREGSQYLEMPNPPVTFGLGHRPVALKSGSYSAEVAARLFDHGVVSILFKIPIPPGSTLGDLVPLADDVYDNPALDMSGKAECDELCRSLAAALEKPHTWDACESYHVVFIEKLEGDHTANEVLQRENLTKLLLGEQGAKGLSDRERFDVTKNAFSYFDDDLAVVDWNSAFVWEPSGSRDIPDILEIATAQLLELRYYDDLLDRELLRIYDTMGRRGGWFRSLLSGEYASLRRKVTMLMLEVAECTERVENSLKIIGDFYLARVYRAAVRRFRIASWQASVDRKEALVAQVWNLLKGEVDHDRMFLLEATIVVLILIEIVMAIFKIL